MYETWKSVILRQKKLPAIPLLIKAYISDILIDDNMVTLNRVEKSGDIYNVNFTGVYYE